MSSRAGRATRVGRGVAAAAVATFVATLSHAAVGGELPPFANIVLALCLAAPVCVMLAGRALSWGRLALAVVVSQALFHALLVLDLQGGAVVGAGHHATTALLQATPAHAPAAHEDSPWMWAAHALAAVVTVLAVGRGEQTLRAVARFFVRALRVLRPVRGLGPTDAAPPAPAPLSLPRALTVLSTMRHRGPPLAA